MRPDGNNRERVPKRKLTVRKKKEAFEKNGVQTRLDALGSYMGCQQIEQSHHLTFSLSA